MSPSRAGVSTGRFRHRTGGPSRRPLDLAQDLATLVAADAPAALAYGGAARRQPSLPMGRHRGHPKLCPVCRRDSGYFQPFGLTRRRGAQCPACGSLERHRFLWLHLERALRMPRRLSVLHVAPEACIRDRLLALPQVRYTAIDLFRPGARPMDVTSLALADASIDLLLCSHVLEHVHDDRAALAEFARVVRPGGRVVIMVPLDLRRATVEDAAAATAAERLAAFGHPYHVRICGADYEERIAAAGFAVERIDSDRLPAHRRRYHRINRTSLFDCRRTPGA